MFVLLCSCMAHSSLRRRQPGTRHIGYARVSTTKQSNEGSSLEAQRAKLMAAGTARGVEMEIFWDDESGSNMDRVHFAQILSMLDQGQLASLIVCKLDRMTRSVADLDTLVRRFESRHVSLISLAESLDTSTAMGRFFITLLGSLAQLEREIVSERTKSVLQYKRASGQLYNHAPYGFDRVGFSLDAEGRQRGGQLERNDREFQVAKQIIAVRDTGAGFHTI